ncbi:MAG: hypothetical protein C0622_10825 [Desulfuromonas sp.]|nr:MAG: hypothetical protein C0622_10825 [Desulfuromonas sp.]
MSDVKIYKNSTDKPFDSFLEDLTREIEAEGFNIYHRDKSDLVAFYCAQGVEMPEGYRHVMFQICKPENSGKSIPVNPERCVFLHKYIFIYTTGGKTEIRFLGYTAELIGDMLGHNEFTKGPSDDDFATRMNSTYAVIEKIVARAV